MHQTGKKHFAFKKKNKTILTKGTLWLTIVIK